MAKLTNIRERVQQPFRDSLIRTSGLYPGQVQDQSKLFTNSNNAKTAGDTNLETGNVLPSDQSMIILALRVFLWFRNSIVREVSSLGGGFVVTNGDIGPTGAPGVFQWPGTPGLIAAGNGLGDVEDVYRLYWQAGEQLFWTFGAGQKPSIVSMPSVYFPYGGSVVVELGSQTDLIHGYNGNATHEAMLKLARAILLVPRQNIQCGAQIVALSAGGNDTTFGTSQGSRNMLSLTANLNAVDAIQKVISFTFDGLLSRDVQ